ncbi:transmembrane protein 214 [Ambystoma mexicanum]|uniref:transmembrane protein 214 n=1 Tax=Ambystoma mexicanum TaxID=8296 RepID=UPI0037E84A41
MASVTPGKWEVVKKNKKPGGGAGGKKGAGGGGARKALGEANLPRILDPAPPIKTSDTIFELGFEKTMKKQNKEQVPPAPTPEQPPKKPSANKNAKKSPAGDIAPKPGKYRTIEDAVKALDLADLQAELTKSQNMFPENPSVWAKDLAGYLNFKLQAPKSDPTLSQHTHDYPYCLASKELKSIIRSLLAKCSDALELFLDHCIFTMLQELDKPSGESLHGYRICIQAVLLDKPKIATMDLGKYLELLRSHQGRPAKCLTIMWALGQAGFSDLTEGLKVWLGIMLPVLGTKALSPFAIAYLDRLLMMHANLTKGFGLIGPKDFFPLLDFAFMPKNSLAPSLQEQLRHFYPRLKVLAFGGQPETTLHTYFPSFLSRATPNCPKDMKKELLNCLTECLNMDPLSFSVWRQLYTKHLSQSGLLLNHLSESCSSTSRKMRKSLQETVHSFKVTNEECSTKGTCNPEDMSACDAACKVLLHKMRGGGFRWSRLLFLGLVFISGFVMYDIRSNGSFQASASALVLRRSGLMEVSEQAWNKVSHFSLEGYRCLENNVPFYYSQVAKAVGPNLELACVKMTEAATYLSDKCSHQIAWLKDNLPWFIEWLQSRIPDSLLHLLEYLREFLLYLYQKYLLPSVAYVESSIESGWKRCVDSCSGEVTWDCMKTHLTSITYASWTYLQNTTLALKNWALAMISSH